MGARASQSNIISLIFFFFFFFFFFPGVCE
jgi:hypothetical protein